MSDFTGGFWDLYIAVITIVGILGCAVLLRMNSVRKIQASQSETTGHVWDEDLAEGNNPLPHWWVWLFYITIVFSLAYLVLYPGLGSYEGTYEWSSAGQYEEEMKTAEAQIAPIYGKFMAQDLKQVAASPEARMIGEKLFLNYCAQCHASDARGSRGFPNLADGDWLWGGDPEAIKTTIAEGRNGVMPPFGPLLGEEGVRNAAHYVMSLSGLVYDSIRAARGKEIFAASCAACHGADAKGNYQMGAPNLTDRVWLHGSSEEYITETITKGRNDFMPAHRNFLGEAKIHLLAAYVYGMSNSSGVAPPKSAK
jgi:cytochrome c oxidase cbb3-type subunit 3